MWSRAFGKWFGRPSSIGRKDTRRRSQRQNSTSKSNSPKTPSQNSSNSVNSGTWWGRASSRVTTAMAGIGATMRNALPKNFEVPVKVDVDLIRPTLVSMRDGVAEHWNDLTPQARVGILCLGSIILSSYITHSLDNRTLLKEKQKTEELKKQLDAMIEERKSNPDAFLGDGVMHISKLTEALASATSAASRAAEAAAVAAESCAIRTRRGIRRVE